MIYLITRPRFVWDNFIAGVPWRVSCWLLKSVGLIVVALVGERSGVVLHFKLSCVYSRLLHFGIVRRCIPVFSLEFGCHLPRRKVQVLNVLELQIVERPNDI